MKNYRNKRNRTKMWLAPFFVIGIGILTGLVIMSLWNWIMPAVFGLGIITFWQAVGMFILGRLLFGRFKKHRHWGRRHQYAYAHIGRACRHNDSKNAEGE